MGKRAQLWEKENQNTRVLHNEKTFLNTNQELVHVATVIDERLLYYSFCTWFTQVQSKDHCVLRKEELCSEKMQHQFV